MVFLTVFCALFLLCACQKVEDMGTLFDLSKPYAGEYSLKKLTLGGEDYTNEYKSTKLILRYDGTFKLAYKAKDGQAGDYAGEYAVATECEEITFSYQEGRKRVERTFSMRGGSIFISLNSGEKLLYAEFAFPE